MKNVYLDTNVFIDIENKEFDEQLFLDFPNTKYYFSYSHIDELLEGRGVYKLDVQSRLNLIDRLAENNCIFAGINYPQFLCKNVFDVYNETQMPIQEYFRSCLNLLSKQFSINRDELVKHLTLEKKTINNIPPENILSSISDAFTEVEGYDIDTYLYRCEANGRGKYYSLFNLLDFVCYHSDKQTEHSDIARLHDASHAYCAQLCDVLVTQDKKMRYKAKAVFSFFGVSTIVLDVNSYLNGKW